MDDLERSWENASDTQKLCFKGSCCCSVTVSLIFFIMCMTNYAHLGPDEQVLIKTSTGSRVVNGPRSGQLNPFQSNTFRKATLLDPLQYAVVQDRMTAEKRVEEGPQLLFLEAFDELLYVESKLVLERDEYVRLVDNATGDERVERGPGTIVPSPTEFDSEGVQRSIYLNTDSAVVIRNKTNGMLALVTLCNYAYGTYAPAPLEEIVEIRNLIHVLPHEAVIVRDVSGQMKVYTGMVENTDPDQACLSTNGTGAGTAFFLPPYSKIVRMAWSVYPNPGMKYEERAPAPTPPPSASTGGPRRVAVWEYVNTVLNDHMLSTSQYLDLGSAWRLNRRAFFAFESYVTNAVGVYEYYNSNDNVHEYTTRGTPRAGFVSNSVAFFAYSTSLYGASAVNAYFNSNNDDYQYSFQTSPPGPDWQLRQRGAFYAFQSATGSRRLSAVPIADEASLYVDQMTASSFSGPKEKVAAIDLRINKAFYNYEVRTSDNVKMELEGTIFWQVLDIQKMIKMTSDPAGDVWAHARSTLVGAISNSTLTEFMLNFNTLAEDAFLASTHDDFYSKRGIEIANLEMTKYSPVDDHTKGVLQEIVRQTVTRINELQKQRSRNDVESEKLAKNIDLEKNKTTLIQSRALNNRILLESAGSIDGMKGATEITSFVKGLDQSVTDSASRMTLYKEHKSLMSTNTDASHLSSGAASLYVAKENMKLRLQMPGATGSDRRAAEILPDGIDGAQEWSATAGSKAADGSSTAGGRRLADESSTAEGSTADDSSSADESSAEYDDDDGSHREL